MPVFNLKAEQTIMAQYVADFLPADSLKNFILGMQMAQATGMRHTLELARTRWPDATGVCYYKLTDNNPAASWATVDWYGVPKIAYHILRGAYRPLHVCLLFRRLAFIGVPIAFPIFLLDDDGALADSSWTVRVRAFDSALKLIKRETFHGSGEQGPVARLGELALDTDQTWSCPLFITADISTDSGPQDSVFYWLNYAAIQGSLFDRPATQLAIRADDEQAVTISNIGESPAVGLHFDCPSISHHFSCADSYFWLDAGQERRIEVSQLEGIGVAAWNAEAVRL